MATYVAHEMKLSFAKKTKPGKASPKAKTAEVDFIWMLISLSLGYEHKPRRGSGAYQHEISHALAGLLIFGALTLHLGHFPGARSIILKFSILPTPFFCYVFGLKTLI
jgi:hypothetical protein